MLLVDRYEIGERQTSACAAPTEWLTAMGAEASIKQTFGDLVVHTPHVTTRMRLPWTFSTFDYPTLCEGLFEQLRRRVRDRHGRRAAAGTDAVRHRPGRARAPLVVDCLGWRSVLGARRLPAARSAALARARGPPRAERSDDLEIWIDRGYVPAGYSWSFPARDEVRVGVGSFDPRFHVKDSTVRLAGDLERDAVRYQGNWIPHKLRDATEGGVFFVGDSAGHCLPLTAEGIRTAFYFGIACGRELRRVVDGTATRETALRRYGPSRLGTSGTSAGCLRVQRLVPRVPPRLLAAALRGMSTRGSWAGRSATTCGSPIRPTHASSPRGPPRRQADRRPSPQRRHSPSRARAGSRSGASGSPGRCPPAAGPPRPRGPR